VQNRFTTVPFSSLDYQLSSSLVLSLPSRDIEELLFERDHAFVMLSSYLLP